MRFASQFDPQPFHLDEYASKGTLFKGLAASGWHTAALTMRLLVDGGLPLAGGIVGMGVELLWPLLTRAAVLSLGSEILDTVPSRSKPDRGTVVARGETRNQRDEVVQIIKVKLLVPLWPR